MSFSTGRCQCISTTSALWCSLSRSSFWAYAELKTRVPKPKRNWLPGFALFQNTCVSAIHGLAFHAQAMHLLSCWRDRCCKNTQRSQSWSTKSRGLSSASSAHRFLLQVWAHLWHQLLSVFQTGAIDFLHTSPGAFFKSRKTCTLYFVYSISHQNNSASHFCTFLFNHEHWRLW